MQDIASLRKAFGEFKNKRVLVVGDIMLDQYTYGSVERVSPEAPVPVLKKHHEKNVLGGAANVANNLASLGAQTTLAGIVGSDQPRDTVLSLAATSRIDIRGVHTSVTRPTTVKHRFVVGAFQQLLRLDDEVSTPTTAEETQALLNFVQSEISKHDIIVLSDYAKGCFSADLTKRIFELASTYHKPVVADFKPKNKALFFGATVITPNSKEALEMTGTGTVEQALAQLVQDFQASVLITRGGEGVIVGHVDGTTYSAPGHAVKVFDVSGAGDTSVAMVALSLVSGLDIDQAATLANMAGSIVVQKPGTATLSLEELESEFAGFGYVESVPTVDKLWGYEKWIENNDKYCCKVLVINKGFQCSLHYHKIKDEMFVITEGHVRLELGDQVMHLRPGSFIRVPTNTPHRFRGLENSTMIEISTHHDDEDSYRIEESRQATPEEMVV